MRSGELETVPFSKCPNNCNFHGYCMVWFKDPKSTPFCQCHRGFAVSRRAEECWLHLLANSASGMSNCFEALDNLHIIWFLCAGFGMRGGKQ